MGHLMKYLVALLLAVSISAVAAPGDGSCVQHPTAPFCQGEGNGTQTDSTNANVQVDINSNSNSESISNSASSSNASGGSVRSNIDVSGGESSSRSQSNSIGFGGEATIGDVLVTSGVGNIDSNIGSDTTDIAINTKYDATAASAATVFAGYCQTGGSAQMDSGGFSVINTDAFCNHVKAAMTFRDAYEYEMINGSVVCAEDASIVHTQGQFADMCINEQAQTYLSLYHDNMIDAGKLVENTEKVGMVDTFAGYLVRPIAILALLILL